MGRPCPLSSLTRSCRFRVCLRTDSSHCSAGGEAAFLLGLVIPGEAALLLGGVLVSRGQVSLGTMLVVAITAVIVGDSIGYEFGRHGGPRLRASWLGSSGRTRAWARGESFLNRRGGAAVLLGRWVGVLRVLVPSLAGMGRMPYGRFLFWNALGGTLFATTIVMVGYTAGSQYTRVSHLIGQGGFAVLGVVLVAAVGTHFYRSRQAAAGFPSVRGFVRRGATSRGEADRLRSPSPRNGRAGPAPS